MIKPISYINPWASQGESNYFVRTNYKKVGEYRGVTVYRIVNHICDYVYDGCCIAQRDVSSKFKEVIDEIFYDPDFLSPKAKEYFNMLYTLNHAFQKSY